MKAAALVAAVMLWGLGAWGKNKPDGEDLRQQLQTAEGRCIRWADYVEKEAGRLGVAVPSAVGEARRGLEEYRKAPEWMGLRSRTSRTAAEAAGKLDERLTKVQELLELAEDEIDQEQGRRREAEEAANPVLKAEREAAQDRGNAMIQRQAAERRAKAMAVELEAARCRASEADRKAKRAGAAAAAMGAELERKREEAERAAGEKWRKGQ